MKEASANKRRRLNDKSPSPNSAILQNAEHMIEIIAPEICRYLRYKDIFVSMSGVSKSFHKIANETPYIKKLTFYYSAHGISLRTSNGYISNNNKIIGFLKSCNVRNVETLRIETEKKYPVRDEDKQWMEHDVTKQLLQTIQGISKLQSLIIDVHSMNHYFIKQIQSVIHHGTTKRAKSPSPSSSLRSPQIPSLHSIALWSHKSENIIPSQPMDEPQNNERRGSVDSPSVDVQVKADQKRIDLWFSKLLSSVANGRLGGQINNVLKNIQLTYIGPKTSKELCRLQNTCNLKTLNVEVVDSKYLNDIQSSGKIEELHIKKYIANWDGTTLLPLFKKTKSLGLTAGGIFPFLSGSVETDTLRIYITHSHLGHSAMRLFEMMQTIPGGIRRLELWNECERHDDEEQINKWWKWISYPLSARCKQLMLRKLDIADTIKMFEHGMFPNLDHLDLYSVLAPRLVVGRLKKVIPKGTRVRIESLFSDTVEF